MAAPVVTEVVLEAPPTAVWEAITVAEKMNQWYFKIPVFKAEVGYSFKYFGGEPGGKEYPISCKVLEVVPGSKLVHTWSYDDYPHETIVSFELFPEEEKNTRIRLSHTGLDTMPAAYPEKVSAASHQQGWDYIIGRSLRGFVEE
ncbi:SRPBCC family protein [Paraflavitalea pollutisoli]|uniref:SRPBCC family protein n=1 Tax=Paraflavitalea pollutisoli TaxID=3034143 RepID=UPI0023EC7A57|nr:SRPBCC domain-containing protein [Paraflavitalea sp. H1-2-19X]